MSLILTHSPTHFLPFCLQGVSCASCISSLLVPSSIGLCFGYALLNTRGFTFQILPKVETLSITSGQFQWDQTLQVDRELALVTPVVTDHVFTRSLFLSSGEKGVLGVKLYTSISHHQNKVKHPNLFLATRQLIYNFKPNNENKASPFSRAFTYPNKSMTMNIRVRIIATLN